MDLTARQKKYLKKNIHKKPIAKIAKKLNLSQKEILNYLQKRWSPEKYQHFLNKKNIIPKPSLAKKIASFSFNKWLPKNKPILFFLSILVIITYLNSLSNQFVSDDIAAIYKNPDIAKFSFITKSLPSFIRPFLYFTVYNLFGLSPFAFRTINIFFHLGTVLLIYLLVALLTSSKTAFFAAILTAVHPIMIESVAWISGGPYSQYSFFLLLSLILHILSLKNKKFYPFSLITFLLALSSSEKAIIYPLILLALTLAFPKTFKQKRLLFAPFLISSLYFAINFARIPQRITTLQQQYSHAKTKPQYLLPIPVSISSYLELVFWPKDLTLYHSEMKFTLSQYFLKVLFFSIFLFSLLFSYIKNRQIFFWLSFFFITLLPTIIPLNIASVVAERYAYLSACGIFVVIAFFFKKLTDYKNLKPFIFFLFASLSLALMIRTIIRNNDWKNEDRLWLSAAKTSPSSPQNHNNLGDYYARHGNLQKAAQEFQTAISLKPNYAHAHHNLAQTYLKMGKIDPAIKHFQAALQLNPDIWQSHHHLGNIYYQRKNYHLAKKHILKAIEINPQQAILFNNLANIYLSQGNLDLAKQNYQKVLQLDPDNKFAKEKLNLLP